MRTLLCLLLAVLFLETNAQQSGEQPAMKPNAIYAELLGNGILYSINYDRLIATQNNLKFSARVGFSYVNIELFDSVEGIIIPIELLGWVGKKSHFEFGVGVSSQFVETEDVSILGPTQTTSSNAYYLTGRIGYRLQKPTGGFMMRAGFVPMFLLSETGSGSERTEFVPFFGVSLGYSF